MALAANPALRLTALALALTSIGAQADPINWANDASGNWNLPTNWTPLGLPTSASDVVITVTGAKTITHDSGNDTINTLTFSGSNNYSAYLTISNGSSLSVANGGTNGSEIYVDGGTFSVTGGTLTNTGYLQALNGGAINITNATLAGGTVQSDGGGGAVTFSNARMAGGTLMAFGGAITFTNGSTLDGASNGSINISGLPITLATGQNIFATGSIVDNGGITQQGNSDLRITGASTLTLSGTGTLSMADASTRIYSNSGGGTLVNGAGHTIAGVGQVGLGQTVVQNAGVITANVAGKTLNLSPQGGAGGFVNTGVLRAENGGNLLLSTGIYANAGASIAALAGSTVQLNNANVIGGTLATTGSGTITASNSATLDGATQGALTNNGHVILGTGQNVFATGSIVDNGGITQQGNSDLRITGNSTLTLSGIGTLSMADANSRVYSNAGGGTLVNSAGYVIQGVGQIGLGQTVVQNAGVITANVSGQTINLYPQGGDGGFVNTNVLRAENGGTLLFSTGNYTNTGASISALDGSAVTFNNATVVGGTLSTTGSGTITATNAAVLDGSTHGALTNNGNLVIATGQNVFATGSIVDNGGIKQQGNSDLRITGNSTLTLSGTGTLSMADANTRVYSNTGGGTLVNSAGYVIQGVGQIGLGQTVVQNAGVITANVSGQTINLYPRGGDGGFVNTGALRAENGGTLLFSTGSYDNSAGTISALNASSVTVNNATIQGGTIATAGSGAITFTNSATLDGAAHGPLTSNGAVVLASGQNIFATGSIVDNGGITQQGNSDLRITGTSTLTLSGTGTLSMADASTRIYSNSGGGVLENGAGHTIAGVGQIGLAQTMVTNAGTINANVGGQTLNLNPTGPVANQSSGVLSASSGGTLNITTAVSGTGTIRSDSSGTVVLNQSSTTGNLFNNANLTLGASNVTVSTDYSNANFGTGDSFHKRAGVSGTGQILASGTTAQAVTGASVSNGASATPTLTIGNVRVGATTYDYHVANAGTSGPALRGALQTGVNGGNITDSRLSGSGVTAGAYGPVATGSGTGNLGVTFTANAAGALAALGGQAVHIANNFDNVAEQTLNIVLASGAAAYNAAIGSTTPSPVTVANQRVGGSVSQALTVGNAAAAGGFSEALNAGFSGVSGNATTNGGSVSNIAAGASNTGALAVGVNTTSSGMKTGAVTIAYQTDGTGSNGHSGLAAASVGSQMITVSGNVYQTAAGTIQSAPFDFGTVQVGQNVNQALAIRNSATGTAGFVEDLNAAFGASYGTGGNRISGTGTVGNLAAGATSNALSVHVDTSTAGTVNGGIAVTFASAGTVDNVSNGLGVLSAGSSNYGVSGTIAATANVVDQAHPVLNSSPIALGNVRIGSASPTAFVSVTNQATGNQQAALNASIGGNAPITASGSFSGLGPGMTNNGSLAVGFDTSFAGARNGTATIAFVSDASNLGNCAPSCQMTLASQDVAVTGAVFRLANPTITTSNVVVAGRVGVAGPTTAIGITNASPDIYTEGLTATRGATSAGFSSSGAVTNLAAGGSSGAIGVTLNTATAGTFTGTQALAFASTGTGTTGAADLALDGQTVALTGHVYTTAAARLDTPSVNFGIVHVGDSVAQRGVSVTNSAATSALNDTLVASAAGATGPFTNSGNLGSGLGAQQTSATALKVGLNTTTAGTYSGMATFAAASHDADLSDQSLQDLAVGLVGQVNNYASDRFTFGGGAGTLSRSGSTFILDYGTVAQNSGTAHTTLYAGNDATGPADDLGGAFQYLDPADFGESGFAAFMGLSAGSSGGPLTLAFDTATVGSFMDSILLHGVGSNASGYMGAIGDIALIVRGTVDAVGTPPGTQVPEPDSLLLLGLGIPLLFVRRRRAARPAR